MLGFLSSAHVLVGFSALTFDHFAGSLSFRELRLGGLLMPLGIGAPRTRLHASLADVLRVALTHHQRRRDEHEDQKDHDQCDDPCLHAGVLPGSFVDEARG